MKYDLKLWNKLTIIGDEYHIKYVCHYEDLIGIFKYMISR